jgi:hypothetical protein
VRKATGSSAAEQDRAVAVFYERLRAVERELGRIHEATIPSCPCATTASKSARPMPSSPSEELAASVEYE